MTGFPSFLFGYNGVNFDGTVCIIAVDALHAIITNLFRIQIAPVALAAIDAFTVIQDAFFLHLPFPTFILEQMFAKSLAKHLFACYNISVLIYL